MIVVTGGAGFIGSAIIWQLNNRGYNDILVVDHLGNDEKWQNLVSLHFSEYMDKTEFIEKLESDYFGYKIDAIIHMGACSSTTEKDADYLIENNYRYSVRIGRWWEQHKKVRFIYASSAATYGNGENGYDDDESQLAKLRPLNMYGYSKHLFDLYGLRKEWLKRCVGIKYFNVFGPNEYHKGDMRSVINKMYPKAKSEGVVSLFESYRPEYHDGGQLRDFIYVKDATAMTLSLLDMADVGGIFNIGTGKARTWNDVARALFAAMNKEPQVEYIPMPEVLKGKYQYHTQANLSKLQNMGCTHECLSLEDSIRDYVCSYLGTGNHLGSVENEAK